MVSTSRVDSSSQQADISHGKKVAISLLYYYLLFIALECSNYLINYILQVPSLTHFLKVISLHYLPGAIYFSVKVKVYVHALSALTKRDKYTINAFEHW